MEKTLVPAAWILFFGLVIGGFLSGGLYEIVTLSERGAWVLNRVTGSVSVCVTDANLSINCKN
jgi:hypothetical protein